MRRVAMAAATAPASVLERHDPVAAGASSAIVSGKSRVIGVDVARGLALIGMIAAHTFAVLDDNGNPTTAAVVVTGRAAATYVLVAGVSLAFLSGGRTTVRGRERVGVSVGLAVRALLVGAMGLALGYLSLLNSIDGILAFYGLFFLLAIPLLGCSSPVLIGIAAASIAVGPLLILATAGAGLPYAGVDADPTFSTLIHDPVGLLVQLFLTGEYPAVVYLAYICVGLAIGRLDLRSRRVGWWLLGGGLALAVVARAVSVLLLYRMGGLARLVDQGGLGNDPQHVTELLWEPQPPTSWWYLALPTPHSHTPIDLLHTLGSAVAVLGAALLLSRVPVIARVLTPLAAAGSMSLTLYVAHLMLLTTSVLEDQPALRFLAMVVGALALAWVWRLWFRQGPVEALVTMLATSARRAVVSVLTKRGSTGSPSSTGRVRTAARSGARFLGPVACAGVLALAFWAGAQFAAPPNASVQQADDSSDVPEASGVNAAGVAAEPALPSTAPPIGSGGGASPAAAPAPNVDRYCQLSEQLYALDDAHPNQPAVVAEKGASLLGEMPQVAPTDIRGAVTAVVNDYQAEGGVPGATAPDQGVLLRAEASVEAFEDQNC